ncbi:MAG: Unknown protein [uncultured Sulfurovum sp.]|uniref:Uncharacterized protein n=1 Tax=uncultured Sulfurovum sp. TaxID=269237 RepID=A0A6S6S2Y9_9BACT|nr:MAG: Unknown protein [uncultured Sulfurovum sp.]
MISLTIPQSGRTFENFMHKIKDNVLENNNIDETIAIIKKGKKSKSPQISKVVDFLNNYQDKSYPLGIFVDRKREERPYRVGFLGTNFTLKENQIKMRVEGAEPHNCSTLVSLGEADIALAGFDELLTTTQEKLINPSVVTKWGLYNYNLPTSKKIRVAGSAMLKIWNATLDCYVQDIVGFFLIGKTNPSENFDHPKEYLEHLEKHRNIVYVKGRYADMVRSAYPKLNVISVHDVEDAVVDSTENALGLEIVQSGSTLRKKELYLFGKPLFISETLYVANYYTYMQKENDLSSVISTLNPVGYYEDERLSELAKWFYALEKNLGDNWINKPNDITTLLVSDLEIEEGLRPYRLATRYWSASDHYKVEEAHETIKQAKKQLLTYYNKLKEKK